MTYTDTNEKIAGASNTYGLHPDTIGAILLADGAIQHCHNGLAP